MSDHLATRDRIGRLYGYTGPYGTTNPEKELDIPEQSVKIDVKEQQPIVVVEGEETMVFNRFKPGSVGARILSALANGPKTAAQLAHVAGSKTADNILAPGGWFYQLRKFGKTSGKFKLEKDGNKLVLTVSKRYAAQV
jgi:hypothetical protein